MAQHARADSQSTASSPSPEYALALHTMAEVRRAILTFSNDSRSLTVSPICEHVFVTVVVSNTQLPDVVAVEAPGGVARRVGSERGATVRCAGECPRHSRCSSAWSGRQKRRSRRAEAACTWKSAGFRSAAEQLAVTSGTSVTSAQHVGDLQASRNPAGDRSGDAYRPVVAREGAGDRVGRDDQPHGRGTSRAARGRRAARQVRNESLKARAGVDRDAAHARIHAERQFSEWTDPEGAWNFRRGTPEDGARFHNARPHRRRALQGGPPRRPPRIARPREFDAAIELARRNTGAGTADPGAKPARTVVPAPADPSRPRRPATRRRRRRRGLRDRRPRTHPRLRRPRTARRIDPETSSSPKASTSSTSPTSAAPPPSPKKPPSLASTPMPGARLHPHPTPRDRPPHRLDQTHTTRPDDLDPSATTTTTSRPTTAGHSSKAKDLSPWSHPTDPRPPNLRRALPPAQESSRAPAPRGPICIAIGRALRAARHRTILARRADC